MRLSAVGRYGDRPGSGGGGGGIRTHETLSAPTRFRDELLQPLGHPSRCTLDRDALRRRRTVPADGGAPLVYPKSGRLRPVPKRARAARWPRLEVPRWGG